MAFRASTKRSPVKKTTAAEPKNPADEAVITPPSETVEIPPQGLTIDDFVGAPVAQPDQAPVAEAEAPTPSADEFAKPAPSRIPQGERITMNASDFGRRRGGPRGGGFNRGGGYNRGGGFNRGGGYNRGGGNDFRDRGDRGGYGQSDFRPRPQRDFTYVETSDGVTQDISVPTETVKGMLDMMPEGHGFLRPKFTPSDRDVYISQSQIRRFLLRNGDQVEGQARPPKDNERYWGLLKVEKINERVFEETSTRPKFEDLVPIYPNVLLKLETGATPISTRIIDLLAPIGFGQRGLIVSPPKAGKTTILKEMAAGITANYPDVHLMAALIGERPEEVTDLTRSIKGEVLASNFDESPQAQTRVAEVALDRAKRLVEMGKDVVILLDSITRLARAYNLVVNPSGRTLSGGFDPAALYPAKKFLGAARCVEAPEGSNKPTGGSLTVIGTALVETGSRMDDLIYEEFKGTGNMELHLSRQLQERRIFPAIDIGKSGTRHDELLLGEETMKSVTTLRHMLALLSEDEQSAMMIDRLSKTKTNADFLDTLKKGGA